MKCHSHIDIRNGHGSRLGHEVGVKGKMRKKRVLSSDNKLLLWGGQIIYGILYGVTCVISVKRCRSSAGLFLNQTNG